MANIEGASFRLFRAHALLKYHQHVLGIAHVVGVLPDLHIFLKKLFGAGVALLLVEQQHAQLVARLGILRIRLDGPFECQSRDLTVPLIRKGLAQLKECLVGRIGPGALGIRVQV